MARAEDHIGLANRCHDTLAYLLLRHDSHPEMIVVAAFYKAVHVVEAMFAHKKNHHSHDHKTRNSRLSSLHPAIFKQFKKLHDKSIIARYLSDGNTCFTVHMTHEEIVDDAIKGWLNKVESMCVQEIGNTTITSSLTRLNVATLIVT